MHLRPSRAFVLSLLSIALLSSTRSGAQADPGDQLTSEKLASLASTNGGPVTDCGTTEMYKPSRQASLCAKAAFDDHKPFFILYSGPNSGLIVSLFHPHSAYGLAGDAKGNLYEVLYDSRGLLNLSAGSNSHVFNDNRIRVTPCLKPIRIGTTEDGMVRCIIPVDEQASKLAARQKPIDTTVCAVLNNPAAFNNKLVRVRGYVSASAEYSELEGDGCSRSIWFAYGNGEAPLALVAYVNGGASPGAQDPEGKLILPVPVKLVQDSHFRRFQRLMKAAAKANARSEKRNADSPTFHRVAATFVGRIDGVSDDIHAFHLKRKATDKADFLGFGQMGLFDAQLVMQSVAGDAVLETLPPGK